MNTLNTKIDNLNYGFIYARIIGFLSLYFSIYAFPMIGEFAFLPTYILLLAYTGIFLLVTFVIVAVIGLGSRIKPPGDEEVAEIQKKSQGWWGFLYNAFDISMFWFMSYVYQRNGFSDMAGWMDMFFFVAILFAAEGLWLKLWVTGKFR